MITGSLLQSTAYTRSHLIVARVVAGFGLGVVNSAAPVLQSEYSPKANRGLCKSQTLEDIYISTDTKRGSRLHATLDAQLWDSTRLLD